MTAGSPWCAWPGQESALKPGVRPGRWQDVPRPGPSRGRQPYLLNRKRWWARKLSVYSSPENRKR